MEAKKNSDRRTFIGRLGIGIAGFTILNSFPFKLFGGTGKHAKKMKVNIHPQAVKRTK